MSAQAPAAASRPPMQALNVRLQFGGVVALNNVSLEIRDDDPDERGALLNTQNTGGTQ